MSVAGRTSIVRRSVLSGLLGVAALAGIAALGTPRLFPRLFQRRYAPTPFDDLFALLPDRENAIRLGTGLLSAGSVQVDANRLARELRGNIGGHSLPLVVADDLAKERLVEADGWLLPASLAGLCALAAMVSHHS